MITHPRRESDAVPRRRSSTPLLDASPRRFSWGCWVLRLKGSPSLPRFQCLEEMPKFDGRKFTEAVPDLAIAGLEEDPACHALIAGGHEVDPSPHGRTVLRRLGLKVDIPTAVAPAQLAHVPRVVPARERVGHSVTDYAPPGNPAS